MIWDKIWSGSSQVEEILYSSSQPILLRNRPTVWNLDVLPGVLQKKRVTAVSLKKLAGEGVHQVKCNGGSGSVNGPQSRGCFLQTSVRGVVADGFKRRHNWPTTTS